MDYPNGKAGYSKKIVQGNLESEVMLKDVPLEVRRREAEKPLFLERYE